ncbi:MAG: 2-hydroxyacyl-CoA dehydratase [Candidatus Schekmanbacteria bacterium]|nr:2-hydroxyacyl-CoA dehydratase [Candidatus Schekmanbacteria bacterium]
MKPLDKRLKFGLNILKKPYIVSNLGALPTIDGRVVSSWEIFWYMTAALFKFPGIFDFRVDVSIRGMTELQYLILSVPERIETMRQRGLKIVGKWSVNPTDLYFGSGVVALDPFFFAFCRMLALGDNALAIRGRAYLSPDACPAQAAAYALFYEGGAKLDLFYPFVGPWCYDSQYCYEALRSKYKGFFGESPCISSDRQKNLSLEFMLSEVRSFLEKIAAETGKPVDTEKLRREFIRENKIRDVTRKIQALMLEDCIPLGSLDLIMATFISGDWLCDPAACLAAMERIYESLRERVRKGQRGWGVADDPVRILVTGIAWGDLGLYNVMDDMGGVLAGTECVMNNYQEDIPTIGDPVQIMAERFINTPYTFGAVQKALWTLSNIKRMGRVDGVVFNCNFGCNYNAAAARIVTDTIKEHMDIPILLVDSDLPGENRGQMRTRFGAFFEMIRKRKGRK